MEKININYPYYKVLYMDFNKDFIISVIRQHRDDEEYYTTVLNTVSIPHDFFYHHINIFNTYLLSKHCILEDETIQYFLDEEIVEHTHILKYQILSSSMLKKYIQNINPLWDIITEYQDISCNILQIYADKLNWLLVSENQFMGRTPHHTRRAASKQTRRRFACWPAGWSGTSTGTRITSATRVCLRS